MGHRGGVCYCASVSASVELCRAWAAAPTQPVPPRSPGGTHNARREHPPLNIPWGSFLREWPLMDIRGCSLRAMWVFFSVRSRALSPTASSGVLWRKPGNARRVVYGLGVGVQISELGGKSYLLSYPGQWIGRICHAHDAGQSLTGGAAMTGGEVRPTA